MIGAYDAPPLFVSDVTITTGDYNGDGRADLSTKTNTGPQTGRWRVEFGTNEKDFTPRGWSVSSDFIYGDKKSRAVPADYDGDGKTDYSISATNGEWRIIYSSNGVTKTFKTNVSATAIPVPGDYDGNGCADIAYYDNGKWYYYPSPSKTIKYKNGTVTITAWKMIISNFGIPGSHLSQADYDGDGITDASLKIDGTATENGRWLVRYSSTGRIKSFTISDEFNKNNIDIASGVCAAADYNGDGRTDMCVKTALGKWYVLYSPTVNLPGYNGFILMADLHGEGIEFVPVPANYEKGDKKADIAIFDLRTGAYHIDFSSNGFGSWDFATDEGKGGDDFNTDNLYHEDINNLDKLQSAYFNLILGDTYYKGNRQKNYYLALMHHNNLNVIFTDQKIYNQPFNEEAGKVFLAGINTLNPNFKEHIYAIDLGDEPTGCQLARVKEWTNFFNTTYLNRSKIPVFYNLLPTYAAPTLLSINCSNVANYSSYLDAFISSNPNNSSPFISFDHYPFGADNTWQSDYFENLRLISSRSKLTGNKPFWATIGTNSSILKRKLTYPELKFSAFTPIAYGAKGVMYWTYNNFINGNKEVFNNVAAINHYLKDIVAPVIMTTDHITTLHRNNTTLNGTNYFLPEEKVTAAFNKDKSVIRDFSSNDIVAGVFSKTVAADKTSSGPRYYLWIVSKKTKAGESLSNVQITLNGNFSNQVKIAPSVDTYNITRNSSFISMRTVFNKAANTTVITISKIEAGEGLMISIGQPIK